MLSVNILFVFCFLHFASLVICQHRFGCDGFCSDRVGPCLKLNCTTGRVAKNATKCGCCDVCVDFMKENDPCERKVFGSFPRKECGPRLTCDGETSKCVPVDTQCMRDRKLTRSINIPLVKPQGICDDYGFYEPVVCLSNVLCYCVDKNGKRIFGTDVASMKNQMHCNCSREFASFPRSVPEGDFLRCLPNGNYDTLQCTEEWCYCMQDGILGYGQAQNVNESLENLVCYNKVMHDGQDSSLLSKCWKERKKLKDAIRSHAESNITLIGMDMPKCDLDGSYAPVQCRKSECFCVSKEGKIFNNSKVNRNSKQAKDMNCGCLRDKELIRNEKVKNANMELFLDNECNSNGNYKTK